MDFKTAMEHYKAGAPTEDERNHVEEELEKYNLITEYLDSQWEIPEEAPSPDTELGSVKKLLKNHDRKTILKSVAVVAALILFITCVLVPLTEALHWSPNQYHYSENDSDLKLTLQAYTELFHPGKAVTYVQSSKTGYASYDLRISLEDLGREEWEKVEATLELSDLSLEADFYDADPRDGLPFRQMAEYEIAEALDTLEQLPEYITIRAAVTFPEDMNMEHVFAFWTDHTWSDAEYPLHLDWVAVRNCTPEDSLPECGFSMNHYGPGGSSINKYYPEFYIASINPDGKYLEQHFISLLQYSSDQWEKGRGMDVWGSSHNYYDVVLEYVVENGIMSYGCIVTGSPKALLSLLEEGAVTQIQILDGWLDVG